MSLDEHPFVESTSEPVGTLLVMLETDLTLMACHVGDEGRAAELVAAARSRVAKLRSQLTKLRALNAQLLAMAG